MDKAQLVWVGNFGTYLIPKEFKDVKIAKSGLPDMRFSKANEFLSWVKATDKPPTVDYW